MTLRHWNIAGTTAFGLLALAMGYRAGGAMLAAAAVLLLLLSLVVARGAVAPFNPRQVTISSFWYVTYLLMIFLPAFEIYHEMEGPYRGTYLLAVSSVLLTAPAGWRLANFWSQYRPARDARFLAAPMAPASERQASLFLGLSALAVALSAAYIIAVPTIPLFHLLRNPGDYLELLILREESFKLLESRFTYFYYLLRAMLYPFLILVAFGAFLTSRARFWRYAFLGILAVGTFYCALSLAKAPVSVIFLVLGLYYYYFRAGKLNSRMIALVLVLVLLFPVVVVLGIAQENTVGLAEAGGVLLERLFISPAEVVYYYYEVFPKEMPFLHGRSVGRVAWLLGMDYFDTANFVGRYGYPQYGETTNANGAFLADFYADFGIAGALFSGVLAGFLMQSVHIYLVRRRKTVATVATYAFLVYSFWLLHSISIPTMLASQGGIAVLLLGALFDWQPRPLTGAYPAAAQY